MRAAFYRPAYINDQKGKVNNMKEVCFNGSIILAPAVLKNARYELTNGAVERAVKILDENKCYSGDTDNIKMAKVHIAFGDDEDFIEYGTRDMLDGKEVVVFPLLVDDEWVPVRLFDDAVEGAPVDVILPGVAIPVENREGWEADRDDETGVPISIFARLVPSQIEESNHRFEDLIYAMHNDYNECH